MPIIAMLLLAAHVSGTVIDHSGAVLSGVSIIAHGETSECRTTTTDEAGRFNIDALEVIVSLDVEGQYIQPLTKLLPSEGPTGDLRIEVQYRIPPIHQSIVITASDLEPQIETHN